MNVLMVLWDGGGNVPPFLGIGRELVRRGHHVRCLGPEALRGGVERESMAFVATVHGAPFDPREPLPLAESQMRQGAVFFGGGYANDVSAAVERERPDVVVVDCFLAAAHAELERCGVPHGLLAHTPPSWFVPFWDAALLAPTNYMRARSGLAAVGSVLECWAKAGRVLVTSTPLMEVAHPELDRLTNIRYTGPVGAAGTMTIGHEGPSLSEPLVLVTFSTTAMGQELPLHNVIQALSELPVRAIVTTGPAVRAAGLPQAPNVEVREWVSHAEVLPRASLMVTHAGHGSVMTALSFGVPLLCMPLGRDQMFIAERVQAIGAGRHLPADSDPLVIAEAVGNLLRQPRYEAGAARAAMAIAAIGDGAVNGASELERMVQS